MISNSKLLLLIGAVCFVTLLPDVAVAEDNLINASGNTKKCFPFIDKIDQKLMVAPSQSADSAHKTYILPATPATTQWGVFNNHQPPVLIINPGDSVSIETMAASDNQVVPGTPIEDVVRMNDAVPGRGPHTITGPIYIQNAEPGDILKIHFNKILPRSYASNNNVPGKGLFPEEFPEGQIKYFYLDVKKMQMQFAPGIVIPLAPFPGLIAVAHGEPGNFDTIPPGPFGGNMDLREMKEGTTLYLPVFVKGGLLWTGDSHAGQGNGEINLTAIETAYEEFNITVDLIKQKPLSWPRVETSNAWITVGYDADLNKALEILKSETVKLIMEQNKASHEQAEKIMFATWNCPISEVVNGIKGVYCMIPKQVEQQTPFHLPQKDTSTQYVTYAQDKDVENAMKKASMEMLTRIAREKKLTRLDAYSLLSLTMDCRIAPYKSGDKEVHCMLDKNLWVS
ncbi:acetamidase/formamidase family protein [Legionella parisiensis]|uniref:Acetamidase n=1 Tax=Legionella parisiensis TaxID=45071 RepID=A0A1E5JV01_9GAMM|nr:acetamidase/formamidase family protein [Legionella parisiensis]KTD41159.1 amidase [Legionella parisiensis]OEH48374.1 Acetamidase [Legionella parisiensis]STX76542.1 amidase [Legionella parisiensis]